MNIDNDLTIRPYVESDHSDVRRIFALGVNENLATKIWHGLGNHIVLGYLAGLFALGFTCSVWLGLFALLTGLSLHSLTIYLRYVFYCR